MRSFARATVPSGSSEQAATEVLTAIDRPRKFDLGLETAESVVIFDPNQRSVDSGGANLKHIGTGDWVGDIEKSGYGMTNFCTSIHCHRLVIEPLGHHLER